MRWLCKKESAARPQHTDPQHVRPRPAGTRRSRRRQNGPDQTKGFGSSYKVLWAGGSVATLAALAIVPGRVGVDAIAHTTCQEVIKSGAEISRGQLSSLAAIPAGTSEAAVRQVVSEPYCLLPIAASAKTTQGKTKNPTRKTAKEGSAIIQRTTTEAVAEAATETAAGTTSRQAYPLAFDPESWVVVSYSQGSYTGYDFVFKP